MSGSQQFSVGEWDSAMHSRDHAVAEKLSLKKLDGITRMMTRHDTHRTASMGVQRTYSYIVEDESSSDLLHWKAAENGSGSAR